jgi:hypothetical protein
VQQAKDQLELDKETAKQKGAVNGGRVLIGKTGQGGPRAAQRGK